MRYRDFFDLYVLQGHPDVSMDDSIALMRKKEIREVVTPEAIARHWQDALKESEKDKRAIFMNSPVEDDAVEAMVKSLEFPPIYPQSPE